MIIGEDIHKVGRQQNACFLFEELCIPSAQELVINCKYVIKFSLCFNPFLFPTKLINTDVVLKYLWFLTFCSKEAIHFSIPAV